VIRFLVIHKTNGDYTTVLDACQICGGAGYRQQGANIICRNCAAVIYGPSVGEAGGCNPIPVKSHVEGQQVVVDLTALADAVSQVHK
jgi:high-affinity iron transporter